jgi:hypothetical protein
MKNVPTVYELRKAGYQVEINHRRIFFRYDPFTGKKNKQLLSWHEKPDDLFVQATGGSTTIELTTPEGTVATAVSLCSNTEHFCRKVGIKKALARALGQLA